MAVKTDPRRDGGRRLDTPQTGKGAYCTIKLDWDATIKAVCLGWAKGWSSTEYSFFQSENIFNDFSPLKSYLLKLIKKICLFVNHRRFIPWEETSNAFVFFYPQKVLKDKQLNVCKIVLIIWKLYKVNFFNRNLI